MRRYLPLALVVLPLVVLVAIIAVLTMKPPPSGVPEPDPVPDHQPRLPPPSDPGRFADPIRPEGGTAEPGERPPVAPDRPDEAVIGGLVTGPAGEPIEGALVYTALEAELEDYRALTDERGRFRMELKPGSRDVIAVADGLLPGLVKDVAVLGGDIRDLGEIRLGAGEKVSGRVVTTEGGAVPGAKVAAARKDLPLDGGLPTRSLIGAVSRANAGEDGSFVVSGLAPGPLLLAASKLGYVMTGEAVESRTGEAGVVIEMKKLRLATGRVLVEEEEKAIAGATVRIEIRGPRYEEVLLYKTIEDGRFAFDLSGSDYDGKLAITLLVSADGHEERTIADLTADDLSPEMKFVVELTPTVALEPGVLVGRVIYDTGAPFIGTLTLYFAKEGGAGEAYRTETDQDGGFRLEGIPPGTYGLKSAAHSRTILKETGQVLVILPGGEERTEFTMVRGGDVTVQVRGDADLPEGVEVSWMSETGEILETETLLTGSARFSDLPPGPVTFKVTAPGFDSETVTGTVMKDRAIKLRAMLREAR